MRILIATGIYPPDIGGPAQYSEALRRALVSHGHEVVVVSYGEAGDDKDAEIYRVSRAAPVVLRYLFYFLKVLQAGAHADIIYAQDPVSSGLPAHCAAKILRKPFVLKVVGDYAWEQAQGKYGVRDFLDYFQTKKYGWKIELLKNIEKRVAKSSIRVIVPSKYLEKIVRGWDVLPLNIKIIYNAVLVGKHSKPNLADRPKTILSAGRLVPWKGYEELIFAMREVKETISNAQLVIVGDGPERAKLETVVLELGLEGTVHLPGRMPHEELPELYSTSRAFVLNTAYEGFSHQLIEVMAAGLPLATTSAGGNAELVRDGENAIVFGINNLKEIKEAIIKLLTDDEFAERIATAAQEEASGFTEEKTFRETEDVLKNVLYSERAMIVSLDATILVNDSPSFRRMLHYSEGTDGLMVLVLGAGSKRRISGRNLYVQRFDGSNKISAFFNAFLGGRKLAKNFRPRVISSQDPFFSGLLAERLVRRVKARLIVEFHGDFWPEDSKLHPSFFRNLIARRVLSKADTIRTVSEKVKIGLLNRFPNLKEKKIEIFPIVSGEINPWTFDNKVRLGNIVDKYPKGAILALFVGRLTKEKGLDWFLPVFAKAAGEIPLLYLRIVGDGAEAEALKKLVRELGVISKIDFAGEISEPLLDDEYRTADFLVLPSRQESWGRVVVEALQSGCPVIATSAVGAAHDILKDGENALVVPFGDGITMEQALIKMAIDKELRNKLGVNGKKAVVGLSYDKMIDKMHNLWKNV